MDKKQYKVLREISGTGRYEYTADPDWKVEIIHYLAKEGYVRYYCEDINDPNKYCIIKPEGHSAIYEWKVSRRRWWIPVAVSVFAAIGGYRQELAWLIQATKSLWISITGG